MREQDYAPQPKSFDIHEGAEVPAGVSQYRMLYRELRAEENVGLSTPILSKLGVDEDDFLKGIGVAERLRILIVAKEKERALLRWGDANRGTRFFT